MIGRALFAASAALFGFTQSAEADVALAHRFLAYVLPQIHDRPFNNLHVNSDGACLLFLSDDSESTVSRYKINMREVNGISLVDNKITLSGTKPAIEQTLWFKTNPTSQYVYELGELSWRADGVVQEKIVNAFRAIHEDCSYRNTPYATFLN